MNTYSFVFPVISLRMDTRAVGIKKAAKPCFCYLMAWSPIQIPYIYPSVPFCFGSSCPSYPFLRIMGSFAQLEVSASAFHSVSS
jgi:hypothetical protein